LCPYPFTVIAGLTRNPRLYEEIDNEVFTITLTPVFKKPEKKINKKRIYLK